MGEGGLKCVGIALLVWSILCLDIMSIILASIVVCGCCGKPSQAKGCIVGYGAVCVILTLASLVGVIVIGSMWRSSADSCNDTITCTVGACAFSCHGGRIVGGATPPDRRRLAMAAEAEESLLTLTLAGYAPRILFPIASHLLYGPPEPATPTDALAPIDPISGREIAISGRQLGAASKAAEKAEPKASLPAPPITEGRKLSETCELPSHQTDPDGSSAAATCEEEANNGWTDAGSYSCGAWEGYDCSMSSESYSYSQAAEDALMKCCKVCCGADIATGGLGTTDPPVVDDWGEHDWGRDDDGEHGEWGEHDWGGNDWMSDMFGGGCCSFEGFGTMQGWHCWSTSSSTPRDVCDVQTLIGNIILAVGIIDRTITLILEAVLLCLACKLSSAKGGIAPGAPPVATGTPVSV